jgi:3-oxoacyl-[acyl-carrier protein] reductase
VGADRQPVQRVRTRQPRPGQLLRGQARIAGFTKTLAIELGRFGVTANAIAPGFIETDMTAAVAARAGISFEDMKAAAAAEIPVGRVGQPKDIAATVSFLVREEASFVSGQVIYVAGGPVPDLPATQRK